MTNLKTSNNTRLLEVIAVITTGIAKFIFVDILIQKFWFILVACLFWISYVIYRMSGTKGIAQYWGFRKAGFKESLTIILPISILSLIVFISYGLFTNKLIFNWHILPILLLYPIWGSIQQFLVIGLIARNLKDYQGKTVPEWLIILIAAITFSAVHYPSIYLLIGTFFLALLYGYVYLKYGNLWILGIFHGWLGCFFYFFVLERDAWMEFTKVIQ